MKNNRYKKLSKNSQCAMYQWSAHSFWNKESKRALRRAIKQECKKERKVELDNE